MIFMIMILATLMCVKASPTPAIPLTYGIMESMGSRLSGYQRFDSFDSRTWVKLEGLLS